MQAAALFALGARLGVAVACLLVVSELADGRGGELGDAELDDASVEAGAVAARALFAE
jgi:hypothetical protein